LLRCLRSLPTGPASRFSQPSSPLWVAPRNRFRFASLTTSDRAAGRRSRRFRAAQLLSLAFARDWLRAPARSLPPDAAAASARRRLCFRTCGGYGLATCRDVRNRNRFRLARTRPDCALLRSTPVSLAACRSPTGKVTGAAQPRFRWRLRAGDATAERLPACPALFSWRISAFGCLPAEADNLRRAWVAFYFGASCLPRAERAANLATDATPESPKALCSKSARWPHAGTASCLRPARPLSQAVRRAECSFFGCAAGLSISRAAVACSASIAGCSACLLASLFRAKSLSLGLRLRSSAGACALATPQLNGYPPARRFFSAHFCVRMAVCRSGQPAPRLGCVLFWRELPATRGARSRSRD
jgi:hypothetical protein